MGWKTRVRAFFHETVPGTGFWLASVTARALAVAGWSMGWSKDRLMSPAGDIDPPAAGFDSISFGDRSTF